MKKILILFVTIILAVSSCQKTDNTYSCDPGINAWVKSNLPEINKMNRNDLIFKTPSVQKAIFRAFSPNQKLQLWIDKIDEVMELNWSEQEQMHILTLRASLKEEWFSNEFITDSTKVKQLRLFLKGWCVEGIEKFGWSKTLIGNMIARTERLTDSQGTLETNELGSVNISPKSIAPPPSCNCSRSDDWCPQVGGYGSCGAASCTESSWGCGTLWTAACTGICTLF